MKYNKLIEISPFAEALTGEMKKEDVLLIEPPAEIVIEQQSEDGSFYKTIPIETLEAMMDLFFDGYDDKIESLEVEKFDNHAIITVMVNISYGGGFMHSGSQRSGVAVNNVESVVGVNNGQFTVVHYTMLLKTSAPLTVTDAKKNAIKSIANIFGRNLNRDTQILIDPRAVKKGAFKKIEPDVIILKKYENAKKNKDTKTIGEIELLYNVSELDKEVQEFKNGVLVEKETEKPARKKKTNAATK